jgi:Tol biopolymer transport system component
MFAFPTVSPDGRWLAYVSNETGRWEVYVRALQAEPHPWGVSTAGGEEPVWDASSRRVYFSKRG